MKLRDTRITGIVKQIINFGYIFVVHSMDVADVMFEMDRNSSLCSGVVE